MAHSEAVGLGGRRHKMESVGGGVFGGEEGSTGEWDTMNDNNEDGWQLHDRKDIVKRTLFKIFRWAGYVTDVYVSWRKRRGTNKLFAFVRFDSRGVAERAVRKLNGTFVGTTRMEVKLAEFQRREQRRNQKSSSVRLDGGSGTAHTHNLKVDVEKREARVVPSVSPVRKSVKVFTDPTQEDILKRSIVAESINTIRFSWTKEQIAEVWNGPGEMACRDIGPFKCLLTSESVEAWDLALKHQGLCELFFEMRPQWGFLYVRSRRVWIEVVGVPVHLWSENTFMKLGKLWGKPVMMDELTNYYLSYTCASILINSYQWETIQKWVPLEDGDRKFDVFVKEFGEVVPESNTAEKVVREEESEGFGRREDNDVVGGFWDPLIDDLIIKMGGMEESPFGIGALGDKLYDIFEESLMESKVGFREGDEARVCMEEYVEDNYMPLGHDPNQVHYAFEGEANVVYAGAVQEMGSVDVGPIASNNEPRVLNRNQVGVGLDDEEDISSTFLSLISEARNVIRVCEDGGLRFGCIEKKLIEVSLAEVDDRIGAKSYNLRPKRGKMQVGRDGGAAIRRNLDLFYPVGVADLQ
ncbi:hypothetical protein PIB30_060724 [Stylosanthes scabra]|uniref:RRM domain-containing protein n=1 Tax=Stylosanthes scabra TaxID=79078 RepID=A0ABU6ZJB2_9FABA|nr:hypothetical protein [Stylosanthes scabra]